MRFPRLVVDGIVTVIAYASSLIWFARFFLAG